MSKLECALLCKCKWKFVESIPISHEDCIACIICFEDANCKGSRYHHRGEMIKDYPSLTITLDTRAGCNPYEVAQIGLNALASSLASSGHATKENIQEIFDSICRDAKE